MNTVDLIPVVVVIGVFVVMIVYLIAQSYDFRVLWRGKK
jgi:hypothetical protein|tara:strand:+ start:1379 stop:1495 length:117 start_codon:yes stop_codon:yes gene_type:complete